MVNYLITELAVIAAVNGVLWCIVLIPPYVKKVNKLHNPNVKAMTLPGVILITSSEWDNDHIVKHELAHIRQMRIFSPLFLSLILGLSYLHLILKHIVTKRNLSISFGEMWRQNIIEKNAEKIAESNDTDLSIVHFSEKWENKLGKQSPC